MKTYESGKGLKMAEEDIYDEGCLPETAQLFDAGMEFSSSSKKKLIKEMKEYYCVDNSAIQLNACEEKGRVDIFVLENENGFQASQAEIASWKEGKTRLWSSVYTYNIKEVVKETVKI